MDCLCINIVYVQVHISMHVRERDMVLEMVQRVMVNTPNVIVLAVMCGVVVLACVIVVLLDGVQFIVVVMEIVVVMVQ